MWCRIPREPTFGGLKEGREERKEGEREREGERGRERGRGREGGREREGERQGGDLK